MCKSAADRLPTKATVLGAGPAGLAAAIALARRGFGVTVIEQSRELGGSGAGLQITPNGMNVLRALGLGDAVAKIGTPASKVEIRDFRKGRLLFELDLESYRRGGQCCYYVVHRADLVRELADVACELGVRTRVGKMVSEILPGVHGIKCKFEDGTIHATPFLVGADGIGSIVRVKLNGNEAQPATSHLVWRSTPASENIGQPLPLGTIRVTVGPGRHVVNYHLGRRSQLNLVAVMRLSPAGAESHANSWSEDDLPKAFADFGGMIPEIIGSCKTASVYRLGEGRVARNWWDDRIVLVGDALHPLLPFIAQGANFGFEDAWVLAREVGRCESLAEGFAAFQKAREYRVREAARNAVRQGRNYHLSNPLVRVSAHLSLEWGGKLFPGLVTRNMNRLFKTDVVSEGQGASKTTG